MSAPAHELVGVTVDGRHVEVPKGTGLVETALAAGIEIPVFCYEPRLGAPIGACRMCLVEVEGMPKLQAGCTLTAQDGMVVCTARTSEKAAEGQNATLEFILVNHPLDCPVCDKGGECPLQDLTFRYGPGSTRMRFDKLTLEKPIPISPAISLDRERCILCYRCTRFSEAVSEDGQLVAANRGSMSVITTFEDEPYSGPFTGNVTELCPVGALLPTQYRFEGRPWEIQSVPTVCGMCPVGCNTWVDMREGKAKRVRSRNHAEIDEGWLCDKGRFAFTHLRASDRIVDPIKRVRRRGFEPVSWDDAPDTERIVLIWSGPGGRGGLQVAQHAERLGLAGKAGCGAFYVPATPNGRGIADAWAACSDEEPAGSDSIGVLIVSGDEAAADPNVRGLAEHADAVIATSMFHGLAVGWADLVLPGTSYLERDGTYVNLEGRLQRLRRTAAPPCPDELEWISRLASRFGVELSPYPAKVFSEVSERCYGGLGFGEVGERAPLRGYEGAPVP